MSIKPVLSFRGVFVGAIAFTLLGIGAFAFGERSYSAVLTGMFTAAEAEHTIDGPSIDVGGANRIAAEVKTALLGETRPIQFGSDRIIVGQGDLPLSNTARLDKVQMIMPTGTPQVLSGLRDFEPSLSPDGKKIVFVSLRDALPTTNQFTLRGYQGLYIMNADGTDQRRLRSIAPGGKAQPSFSPDGQKIVFVSGDSNIWIRDLATGSESQLNVSGCVTSSNTESFDDNESKPNDAFPGVFGPDTPIYSPDGAYIVFGRRSGERGLWRVETNGSGNCVRMFSDTPSSRAPTGRYSPDGSKIAVITYPADPNEEWFHDLAILDATTGAIINQYAPPNFYQSPVWSPDGTTIAYPAAQVDFTQFVVNVGRAVRTYNLQTQQMEEIYVSGSPEGIHGMTWGTPTNEVPAIGLHINSPHPLAAGQSTTGTVYLADPAPPGGQLVSLTMTNGDAGTISFPESNVVIPEGATQATFAIDSPINTTYRSADVVATAAGIGTAQATVSLTATRPDLRAVSFTAPASTAPTVSFAVSWTVDNIGLVSTGTNGGTDLVYFSIDDQWNSNTDQQIQSVYASTPLAPGASRTVNSTATIPANRVPSSGQYYLIFCTNPFGDFPIETELANNCIARPIQVNMPDLIADTVTVPSATEPLTSHNVSWTVRNIGSGNAGSSSTHLFFSNDNVAGNSDDLFLASVSTATLAAGSSVVQNRNVTIPTLPVRPSGEAFFYVKVDANNSVSEGTTTGPGETNNFSFQSTQFSYNVADLQVTASSSAPEIETDTAIPFTWTSTNAGTRAAGTFSEQVYFSRDNALGNDVLLGTFSLTGGLVAGLSTERIQNVTVPTSAITESGNYYIYVKTDSSSVIDEGANEGNNLRFHPLTVRRKMRPDLVITNITAPPTAFFDQTIQVQWTVTNSGSGPTNTSAWKDRVNMNTTGSNSSETRLIDVDSISALAPGESYVASATVKVPRGYNGSYQIVVTADINGALNEETTTNNKLTRAITINVPPLPDLTVSNVQAPEQAFAGGPINVSWQVNNIGTAAAQGDNQALNKPWSWGDRVYLSRDTVLNTSQDRLIHTGGGRSTPLAAGANYTANTFVATSTGGDYVKLPHNVEGLYYVFVLTDYSNIVYEFNSENNNFAYDEIGPVGSPINIIITPPDLVINAQPVGPANASGGQSIDVSFTVSNQGAFSTSNTWTDAIYLSTDQMFGDDTILGTRSNSSIGPGGSRLVEMRVTVPQCVTTGNYYLIARTDTGNVVAEFDPSYDAEANNNSPAKAIQITTLPPDLVASDIQYSPINMPGQSVTVTWSESNIGTGPGPYQWVDRIVLKSLNGLGSVELGRVTQQGAIAAGQ